MTFAKDKEQLVLDNMGLVKDLASKMAFKTRTTLVDYDDFVQVGSMGLMHAAERFDESQGNTFSTYAYKTILGYMMRELTLKTTFRSPVHVVNLALSINRRQETEQTLEWIAEKYNVPIDRAKKALEYLRLSAISSDAIVANTDHKEGFYNLHGTTDDYTMPIVEEFIATLKPRHQWVLHGLMNHKTLRQIAETAGISYQRIGFLKIEIGKRYKVYIAKSAR
ncbi:sigma-70 family RNA polymerase sigma factor [Bacillus sp. FJAT-26390]|uniref:sigma-70 family RNA polymerase sigma factor n=1 Tax=Bacillus sp. FJAT-26390 TaxID=1743142 RepID=UPI000807C50C|nr:sigma-70 family RNA polymerase sigma factor [Bacillus sp. FJAT-26390]OBZ13307.1 hypothetical protein A7975_10640 [Bacillus sp. FJAT-26390]